MTLNAVRRSGRASSLDGITAAEIGDCFFFAFIAFSPRCSNRPAF